MIETRGRNTTGRYSLPAGKYICRVVSVEVGTSKAGNTMIILDVDVAQGNFKDFFARDLESLKVHFENVTWPREAKAWVVAVDNDGFLHWRLEKLLRQIQRSNVGFDYDPCALDETTLVGKLIGATFAETENGKGTRLADFCSVDDVPTTAQKPPVPSPHDDDLRGEPLKDDIDPPDFDLGQFDEDSPQK